MLEKGTRNPCKGNQEIELVLGSPSDHIKMIKVLALWLVLLSHTAAAAISYTLGTNVTKFLEVWRASGSVPATPRAAHEAALAAKEAANLTTTQEAYSRRGRSLLADSITQVVDHKEILKLKPSETAAKDLHEHVGAAASVNMWAPLWPEAHRPGEHAVFGLALNYDIRHFYW